jgi:ribosomal protein L7/L12
LIVAGAILASGSLAVTVASVVWQLVNYGVASEILLTRPQYSALVVAQVARYAGGIALVAGLVLVAIGMVAQRRANTRGDATRATRRFRELRAGGRDVQNSLATLRREGASQFDSVKAVREVESVTLGEAKVIVDASSAWADTRESNESLRDSTITPLDESGQL